MIPSILNSSGAVPPVPVAVIVPSLILQAEAVETAVTSGPEILLTVTETALIQPLPSFASII